MEIIRTLLAMVHVLAGAAWLGAMFYSFFVLHPRGQRYFARLTDFEGFVATLSQGARWKVLGAMAIIGVTGVGLVAFNGDWSWCRWTVLAMKALAFVTCLVLFWNVSWRLWPARILATEEEIPHFHRLFRRSAAALLGLVGLSMLLGVLAHSPLCGAG
jgi:uncharacterized membrane protein